MPRRTLTGPTTVTEMRAIIGEPHPAVTGKLQDRLDDQAKRYIARAPLLMLATADADGMPDVSPRGDDPGFVHIVDDETLLLPERPGNKLAYSLQNILDNPKVSLIFFIPGVRESYRVHGRARLIDTPAVLDQLAAKGKPALLAIEIKVTKAFLHCGKALIRSRAWKHDPGQPGAGYSFGSVISKAIGDAGPSAEEIDAIVKDDYENNLY